MGVGIREVNALRIAILLTNCGLVYNGCTLTLPSDVNTKVDAETIFLATDRNAELIRILPHRTLNQRLEIAEEYKEIDPQKPLVPDQYVPLGGDAFQDLLFLMTTHSNITHFAFLHAALEKGKLETSGTIAVDILMIIPIDFQPSQFEILSTPAKNGYKKFLRDLLERNGNNKMFSAIYANELNDVIPTAQVLARECPGWQNNRMMLDYTLMKKPSWFGKRVILEFNRANGGEDILAAIDKHIPDTNLKFGYKTLVKFVVNPLMAAIERIHDSENEPFNNHLVNILAIPICSESALYEINVPFVQKYKQCIGEYLLSLNDTDPVNRMLAAMVEGDSCESAKIDAEGYGGVEGANLQRPEC